MKLEKKKIYYIKGTIGNICAFEKRHFGGSSVVIVVPHPYMGIVIPGEKYEIGIVSVEERRRFVIRQLGHRAGLVIRRSDLASMGVSSPKSGREVVELTIRKVSEKEVCARIFANVQASTGFLRFSVDGLGAKPGDVFEVVSKKYYAVRDFVEEFNTLKPDTARNVKLLMRHDGTLGILVDGKMFQFKDYSLFRLASRLLLRTKFPFYKMELRFWFDGKSFSIRFGVDDVAGFWISRDGKLRVSSPFDEKAVAAQRELYSQVQRLRNPILRQFEHLLRQLKVVSTPMGVEGTYEFEVDDEIAGFVHSSLQKLTRNEYSTRKGSFGEMIASHILALRYLEIREHPSTKFPKAPGCHKQGVDYEMLRGNSEGVDLLELKWWKNVRAAVNQGRAEASKRLAERKRRNPSAHVRHAFAAALDWDPEGPTGRLIVVKA